MKKNKANILFIFALSCFVSSCYWHKWDDIHPISAATNTPCTLPDTVKWSTDIQTIMQVSCGSSDANCHAPGGTGGVRFDRYNQTMASAPDTTTTLTIYTDITSHRMPLSGSGYSISSCDTKKIAKWIAQGWPQ